MTPYQIRSLQQAKEWLDGDPEHNRIDDECCPDFSCCFPELFTHDREERMRTYNAQRARYGLPLRHDS